MKKTDLLKYAVLLFLLLHVQNQLLAQTGAAGEPSRFFVLHQNKVAMKDMAKANAVQDSIFAPILDELVEEGALIGWGQLVHAWGDEWNFNFYFINENHWAFLDFWEAYVKKLNEQHPDWIQQLSDIQIQEHRDNMYQVRHMR